MPYAVHCLDHDGNTLPGYAGIFSSWTEAELHAIAQHRPADYSVEQIDLERAQELLDEGARFEGGPLHARPLMRPEQAHARLARTRLRQAARDVLEGSPPAVVHELLGALLCAALLDPDEQTAATRDAQVWLEQTAKRIQRQADGADSARRAS